MKCVLMGGGSVHESMCSKFKYSPPLARKKKLAQVHDVLVTSVGTAELVKWGWGAEACVKTSWTEHKSPG